MLNNLVVYFIIGTWLLVCSGEARSVAYASPKLYLGDNSLDAIKNRIQSSNGVINQDTLADSTAWNYMLLGFNKGQGSVSQVKLTNFSIDYTNKNNKSELVVSGTTSLWSNDSASIQFVFYFDQGLEFYVEFDVDLSQIPVTLIPTSSTGWFSGLSLVGTNKVSIASKSFTDLSGKSYSKGLTLEAHVQTNENLPIQKSLYGLLYGGAARSQFNQQVPITGDLTATFPLTQGDDLAHFTLNVDGTIYFGTSNVKSTSLTLDFQLSSTGAPSVTLNSVVNINGQLNFQVTAKVNSQSGFTFTGSLQGSWNDVFGLPWLSFPNLALNFDFNFNAKPMISTFNFQGGLNLAFSSLPNPITVSFSGELDDHLQSIVITTAVPVADFSTLFKSVLGRNPAWSTQVAPQGQIQVTIATTQGSYQAGLTVDGTVVVAPSSAVATAVKALTTTPATKTYQFHLYVPVFSAQPDNIDFSFSESGAIAITSNLNMEGYSVKFVESPTEDITLATTIQYQTGGSTLTFAVTSDIQITSQAPTVTFQGSLQGTWDHPFGLSWLTLQNIQSNFAFTGGKLQTFTIQGTVGITFGAAASTQVTISLPGPDFEKYSFTLEVLIPDLGVFLHDIAPSASVPQLASEVSLSTSMTVSNIGQAGLTLTGNVLLVDHGQITTAVQTIAGNAPVSFTINLFVPIFSGSINGLTVSLSENGNYPVCQSVSLTNLQINIQIGTQSSVSLGATAQIQFNKNPTPFTASISAALGASDLKFTGSVNGNWKPFGLQWISVDSASVSVDFESAKLANLEVQGEAKLTFSSTTTVDFDLKTSSDFADTSFELKAVTMKSFADILQHTTTTTPPKELNDIQSLSNTVDLIISSYTGNGYTEGLTITDTVTITGDLLSKLKIFNQMNGVSTATFELGLTVPLFSGETPDVKIFLQTSAIRIKSNMQLTGVKFEVDTDPAQFSVSTGLQVTFSNNPQLEFDVSGSYAADQTIQLSGDMLGTWENMFGIHGLSISNVDLAVGFNPTMCAVDFCLSALGLGYTLYIGTKEISFYGYGSIPNIEDIFLEGSIKGQNGMALSVQDIVIEWNNLVGNALHIPLNPNNFPGDWGIENVAFYIAPESGTFNQIQYQQGFWVEGGFRLFGLECDVDIKVESGDFEFHVHVSVSEFETWLRNELHVLRSNVSEDGGLVTVRNVTLTNLSVAQLANGNDPQFDMHYHFLGKEREFHMGVPLIELYEGFHYFFDKYLKHLF